MKTPLKIFSALKKQNQVLGAFNFCNTEILRAIAEAAAELKTPVIVATSEGEGQFIGWQQAAALVGAWRRALDIDLILHLDHGKSLDTVKTALAAGYDSVHIDGSQLDFAANIELTKQVVAVARSIKERQVVVEGELGYLRGASAPGQKVIIEKQDLTEPSMAVKFIQETGIDSLAVAIGNVHGIAQGGQDPHLNLDRLAEIQQAVANSAFLVLHGGSGIPDEDIKQAIKLGIVKINVNTELRVAYSQTLCQTLQDNPMETTPYKIMQPVLLAIKQVVANKIKLFNL